jgi:hypothetical protein
MFFRKHTRVLAAVIAALAIGGGTYGIVSATASNAPATTTAPFARAGGGGGSNARSGPAAGGTVGTVTSVSSAGFTVSAPGGQKITVKKAATTTKVKKGEAVLVLGTVNGSTITARQVVVEKIDVSAASKAAGVVPFQRGAPSTAKQIGQIPANYTEGSGTIVSGTAASSAAKAALASYPGGIVDRVVKLSNGEYEVHNIGVNWPHHIFVNSQFKVVGAD